MERLTSPNINVDPDTDRFLHAAIGGKEIDWKQFRDSTLNVLINGPTSNGFGKDIFRKMARDLYGRLKAYEATGLTPEEVTAIRNTLDEYHKVADPLLRAQTDGRLVVLPCKVGDTVYILSGGKVSEWRAAGFAMLISNSCNHLTIHTENYREAMVSRELSDFGKTVFITREEAEKALREIQRKEDADGTNDRPE